jgi:hypothetical protein
MLSDFNNLNLSTQPFEYEALPGVVLSHPHTFLLGFFLERLKKVAILYGLFP